MIWNYCWAPNVKEIFHTKFGQSLSISTTFIAFYPNLNKFRLLFTSMASAKGTKFRNLILWHIQCYLSAKYCCSVKKRTKNCLLVMYIWWRYLHYFRFSPKGLKYMRPSQNEKKMFPPKRNVGKFFGVFRTPSYFALFKNSVVILIVEIPLSFYWTIQNMMDIKMVLFQLFQLFLIKQLLIAVLKSRIFQTKN